MPHDHSAERLASEPAFGSRARHLARPLLANLMAAAIALGGWYPFYVAASASLKSLGWLFGLTHWPVAPTWSTCIDLLGLAIAQPAAKHLPVALAGSVMGLAVSLCLGMTADYAFGRAPFRARLGALGALAASMLLQAVVLSCMFELMRGMHLYNHWWGLALPYMVFTLPIVAWGAVAFAEAPGEPGGRGDVRQAASPPWLAPLQRSVRAALRPALSMSFLVAFIAAWNEFMYALTAVLDHTQRSRPESHALFEGLGATAISWGGLAGLVAAVALVGLGVMVASERWLRPGAP